MKKLFIFVSFIALMFTSCNVEPTVPTADEALADQTEQAMQEANRETGYPAITNFQEKKVMKYIYKLRDQENLVCYAYFFNEIEGKLGDFIGKCIGYGLPYSTQFSNPEKIVSYLKTLNGSTRNSYEGNGIGTIPQPEPNGLFMPNGLSATWLLLIDPDTDEPRPVYIEPTIVVSPFKQTQSYVEGKRQEALKMYKEWNKAPEADRAALESLAGHSFANVAEDDVYRGELLIWVKRCKYGTKAPTGSPF